MQNFSRSKSFGKLILIVFKKWLVMIPFHKVCFFLLPSNLKLHYLYCYNSDYLFQHPSGSIRQDLDFFCFSFSDLTLSSNEASLLTSLTQLGFPLGGKFFKAFAELGRILYGFALFHFLELYKNLEIKLCTYLHSVPIE